MVKVDSGEFKLLRDIDIEHQPSRSKVVTEWVWAFDMNVPVAIDKLCDVIEDVYNYPIIWQERRKSGPLEFLESIGIIGLDLDEPAKVLRELRDPRSRRRLQYEKRLTLIRQLRAEGKTQQAIADEVGISQNRVCEVLSEKSVITKKTDKPTRVIKGYRITQYTKPEIAAQKIKAIFDDDFVQALKSFL